MRALLLVSLMLVGCRTAPEVKTSTGAVELGAVLRLSARDARDELQVTHSARELRGLGEALASTAKPRRSRSWGGGPPESQAAPTEAESLREFVDGTDFERFDVAVLRAGPGRGFINAGLPRSDGEVEVLLWGQCSPCGGGDPGSYDEAVDAYDASERPGAWLVRVSKGARVRVNVQPLNCTGECPKDLP